MREDLPEEELLVSAGDLERAMNRREGPINPQEQEEEDRTTGEGKGGGGGSPY